MPDIAHGVVQLAALFARYPWQSFATVMAVVLLVMRLIGDKPRIGRFRLLRRVRRRRRWGRRRLSAAA